jgi:predicted acyltransferase
VQVPPPNPILIKGTLISTYIIPLHQKHCISQQSTHRSKISFYTTLLIITYLLIHPIPYLLTYLFPMSKPLWTPPFLMQTIGITLLSWILASSIDFPNVHFPLLETMGKKSLEIYLAAEILQEFAMYSGKRAGLWEGSVGLGEGFVAREWSCLFVSFLWALMFAGFGVWLDWMGWGIKL